MTVQCTEKWAQHTFIHRLRSFAKVSICVYSIHCVYTNNVFIHLFPDLLLPESFQNFYYFVFQLQFNSYYYINIQ